MKTYKLLNDFAQTGANKGAAGNAVGRLAVCEIKRFGDRTVTLSASHRPDTTHGQVSPMKVR